MLSTLYWSVVYYILHYVVWFGKFATEPKISHGCCWKALILQRVLSEAAWEDRLTPEDRRALTPLFYGHVTPYGTFHLDLNTRLDIEQVTLR